MSLAFGFRDTSRGWVKAVRHAPIWHASSPAEFSAAAGEIARPRSRHPWDFGPVAFPTGFMMEIDWLAHSLPVISGKACVPSRCPFNRADGRCRPWRLATVQNPVSPTGGRRDRVPPREFVHHAQRGRRRTLQQRGGHRRCSPQRRPATRCLISGRESGDSSPPLSARPVDDRRPPRPGNLA